MYKVKKVICILLSIVILSFQNLTIFASEPLTYYYVEKEVETRTVWDFVDIAMAGASWYDLIKDPSLKNLAWAVLDTAAIAPLVPSSRWIREGSKYIIPIDEIKKLASTQAGKEKLLKALKVEKTASKLDEIAKLAKNYKLTESQFKDHILKYHGYNSTVKNKSKFYQTFDIKKGIKETLTNDSIIKNNTKNREGYIFEKTYSYAIGVDSDGKKTLKTLRVVLDKNGYVKTAFPTK